MAKLLEGAYTGKYIGDCYRAYQEDTRSLDYSSFDHEVRALNWDAGGHFQASNITQKCASPCAHMTDPAAFGYCRN